MTIKLITGEFCSRCHMLLPLLRDYAKRNNYEFIVKDIKEANSAETEGASQLPVIWFDDERKEYDEVLGLVQS